MPVQAQAQAQLQAHRLTVKSIVVSGWSQLGVEEGEGAGGWIDRNPSALTRSFDRADSAPCRKLGNLEMVG